MKMRLTRIAVLALAVVFLYSACKKSSSKPTTASTIDYAKLSSTIAMNLSASIYGKNGGNNVGNGLKSFNVASHKGISLYSTGPACGSTYDTTYTTKATAGDTLETFQNALSYVYTCSYGNNVNGYSVHDSVTNTQVNATVNNTFITSQNYAVVATDATFKTVTMNGSIYNAFTDNLLSGTTVAGYHNIFAYYTLTGLIVDFTSGTGVITTGSARFVMNQYDLDPSGTTAATSNTFNGTIVYLGNNQAKLTINDTHFYTVNLLTGVATPA